MAPLKPVKKNTADQRVQSVLDFALTIAQSLRDRVPHTTNTLSELEAFVKQPFPSPNAVALARKSIEYDKHGSSLWNAATKIFRGHSGGDGSSSGVDLPRFCMLLRAFAFFLLDAAHNTSTRRTKDSDQRIRIFKIALKASRFALDNNDLDLAFKLLESCSKYISAWDEAAPVIRVTSDDHNDEASLISSLTSEYYLFRMAHASKSGRLDLAEHFFLKSGTTDNAGHGNLSELAADLCYQIGRTQRLQKRVEITLLWLERAHKVLNSEDAASLSLENEDLRLAIVASIVEALVENPDADGVERAWALLVSLEQDYGLGNRMAVLVMQLNVSMRKNDFDIDAVSAILSRIVRSSILTDQTYRTIMHSIARIKRTSLDAALAAIEQLINARLLPDIDAAMDNEQAKVWLEKSVVTYTSFCAMPSDYPQSDAIQRLSSLFDRIVERTAVCLAPKATHAMQALIWKSLSDAQDVEAELWLSTLQHSLFTGVGASNKARIARRLMMAAIERDELDTARAAFYGLPQSSQNEGMTRYLAYKLALKSNDLRLASECLASLAKHVDKDRRHLYACVLEAQQSGNRAMAVAAFQALIDRPSEGVQLPALLRCTVRLLMEELEISTTTQTEAMDQIVHIFETASANTKILRQGSEDRWRAEIQWWSKNAFNLALQHCASMPPNQLVCLVRACNKFLRCYPDDSGLMHRDELMDRMQVCHFICASALTVLGRTASDRPQQLQNYLEVQQEVQAFLVIWQQPNDTAADAELRRARALELLRLNVESVFKLEQWDRLDEALAACLEFKGTTRWDTLADLVMVIYDQTSRLAIDSSATAKIPGLLQKIIHETWKADKDMAKLARWLRFTVSIGLEDAQGTMGIKLVEQAASLARRGAEGNNDPYPEDELQWLATTAFNKAVDLLTAGDRQTADQWIEAALELARYAADNGSLHAQLTKTREEAERRMRQKH